MANDEREILGSQSDSSRGKSKRGKNVEKMLRMVSKMHASILMISLRVMRVSH